MKKLLALAALLLLATACGVRPSATIYGSRGPADNPEGTVLYVANGETLTRIIRPTTDPAKDGLTTLAEGLLAVEQAEGLTTAVPTTALPITRSFKGRALEVNLSTPVAPLTEMAKNQLTCTALQTEPHPRIAVILTGPDTSLPPRTCPFAP
jgi:hypothetical protein